MYRDHYNRIFINLLKEIKNIIIITQNNNLTTLIVVISVEFNYSSLDNT